MAHQFDFIKREHILKAIEAFDNQTYSSKNNRIEYWLFYNYKVYPLKYLIEVASGFTATPIESSKFVDNDTFRKAISSLGFQIIYITQNGASVEPKFWIAASYYGDYDHQVNMFDDFIKDEYWATDHYLDEGKGLIVYNKLKTVNINDRIAIRYLARKQSTIEIVAVGTIISITDIDNGRLSVAWDYNPFLYKGIKPSGPGAGDWWKTLIQISRPEDIDLIFGYAKSSNRASRLTWNDNGWIMPSGLYGKSKDANSHEGQYGYGHEEWLLDTGKLIDGYHYGFLEPIRKHQEAYIGKRFNIWLYSINGATKVRYWIGQINDVEVINSEQANEITAYYTDRGWLDEMEQQIIISGANEDGFSGYHGIDLFNIRYKPNRLKLNDPYYELPESHPIYSAQRYTLMFVRDNLVIPEPTVSTDFGFIEPTDAEDDTQPEPRITSTIRPPRPVEITYLHEALSKGLAKKLRKIYGRNKVTREHWAGYGLYKIDIVVKDSNDLIFYEIKSYTSIMSSIREAIGQLMEYALWPDRQKAKRMIIVTQNSVTPEIATYFKFLRDNHNLPLYYQSYDLETNILSEEI